MPSAPIQPRPPARPVSARSRSKSAPPARAPRRAGVPQVTAADAKPWGEIFRPWHVALALVLLHLALALLALDPTPHEGGDSAAYLALARSLLEHGTYQELWDPAVRAHTQYPPGWPLVLAGAMTLGVKPWIGFKVLVTLFSAAAVGLSYLWARRITTPGVALGAAAVLAVAPGTVDLARWELSDVPFWCFTMLALWAFARLNDAPRLSEPTDSAPPARWRAALGPLALASAGTLLAYATRSAGIPLVLAAGGWLAWRRRWQGLALFAGVVGPFAVAWWARGRMVGGAGYAGHLWYVDPYQPGLGTVTAVGMLSRIVRNVVEYTGDHVPYLLIGSRMTTSAVVAGTALVVMAAAGWAMRLRRGGVAEMWLPLYVALLLVWPAEWSGERFILPALPVLLVCAGEVVRLAGRQVGHPVLFGAGVVAVLLVTGMPKTTRTLAEAGQCRAVYGPENRYPCLPENWQDYFALAASMRGRLPGNAAVLARKPTHFWAESGYPARVYPFTASPDSLLLTAREARARYVLLDYLDNVSVMYLAPVMMQRPQAFCVMEAVGPGRATFMALHPDAERIPNVRARPTETETANVAFARCGPEVWAPGTAPRQIAPSLPPTAPGS
jgi:4-amino-4-deoxy-L-arabinose transferase-like glycosyltransferase